MSRDAFLGGKIRAEITGPRGKLIQNGKFETGYQIGYPISFAPSGVSIMIATPSIIVGGSVAIKVPTKDEPSTVSGEIHAEAMIVPSHTMSFTVERGELRSFRHKRYEESTG